MSEAIGDPIVCKCGFAHEASEPFTAKSVAPGNIFGATTVRILKTIQPRNIFVKITSNKTKELQLSSISRRLATTF
jgi:hypothetical protein